MALNFPFSRLTTRSAPRTSILKCVDFELYVYGFDFTKNRRALMMPDKQVGIEAQAKTNAANTTGPWRREPHK